MKPFKGKAIYNPKGRANEYSQWAANLYKGCNSDCTYCFMKKGVLSTTWTPYPVLKSCFRNEGHAFEVFRQELHRNIDELKIHGLLFNFSSDPFLPGTIELNMQCLRYCALMDVPTRTLTKQAKWFTGVVNKDILKNNSFGFTLTGHDELEPGADSNQERIEVMKHLHKMGCKTWVSIEPIIDFESSMRMIKEAKFYCHHFKIGLLSGKKFDLSELREFMEWVDDQVLYSGQFEWPTIYYKDSLLEQAGVTRNMLPENCVNKDFKI